jgi:hypothetical protein
MSIVDNNLLIALFMGGKIKNKQDIFIPFHCICNYTSIEIGSGKILEYHKSWDWLIPVIDKIYSSDNYINYLGSLNQFSDGIFINTKYIHVTYNSVVDYIKFNNGLLP